MGTTRKYEDIRGFNYQPSYGSSGLEVWRQFDEKIIDIELARGKKYFPKWNAIRLWLSWNAFIREPKRFSKNFETALALMEKYELKVMPVLFNRWHSAPLDHGGIYIDHFLPGVSWIYRENFFTPYLESIVGEHAHDERIFMWDLCNEPFSYSVPPSGIPKIEGAEFTWLKKIFEKCKQLSAQAPLCISIHPGHGISGIKRIEPISDILAIHPYFFGEKEKEERLEIKKFENKVAYEKFLDEYVEFAESVGKPLLATETCWGSLDDLERAKIIRYTLGELNKRKIGWLVHALHHSLVADLHRPEFGPVSEPGNLSFIEADGSLRPYHEVWNEFNGERK